NILRTLIDNLPDRIYVMDNEGRKTLANTADWRAAGGKTMADVIGKTDFDLYPPELAEDFWRVDRTVLDSGAPIINFEEPGLDFEGKQVSILTTKVPLFDGAGKVTGLVGIGRDITERKQAEETLRESEALYRQAMEVAGTVPYLESYYDDGAKIKYEFIGEGIRQITGYGPEEFSAKIWDSLVEEINLVDDLTGYTLDEGIQRVRTGKSSIWKCEHRLRARDGKIHWVFEAAVELYDKNGLVYGSIGTYQDITERKQAEEALRESEKRFASIFHTNPNQVSITSFEDGRYLEVNEAFLNLSGYSRQEVIGHTSFELNNWVEPLEPVHLRTLLEEQGRVQNFETQLRRKSGEAVDVLLSAELIELFGQRCILSVGLDITERKQNEQKLLDSNERFHQLADNIQEAFWITDAKSGEDIYISQAAETIWGRSVADFMKAPDAFVTYILPEDLPMLTRVIELQRNGQKTEVEYRVTRPDGTVRWIWDRAFPIFDEFGKTIRVAGIAADVTERKWAEDALRESEERFHSLFDRILDGVYRSTHAGRFVDVNPAMVKMFGFASEAEMLAVDIKHDLYFELTERGSHVLDTGQEEIEVYRMRRKDGSEIWVEDRGSYVHDKQGNISYHEGILRDVTERKLAEVEIKNYAEDLTLVNLLNDAMNRGESLDQILKLLVNECSRILHAHNAGFYMFSPDRQYLILEQTSMTGGLYSAIEKVIGRPLSKINIPLLPNSHYYLLEKERDGSITNDPREIQAWVDEFLKTTSLSGLLQPAIQKLSQKLFKLLEFNSFISMPLLLEEKSIGLLQLTGTHEFTEKDLQRLKNIRGQVTAIILSKRADDALRQSEERYRLLIEQASDGIVVTDSQGRILDANTSVSEIFGYSREEISKLSVADLFPPEENINASSKIEEVRAGKTAISVRYIKRKDDTVLPVEISSKMLPDGRFQAIVRDVSERKKIEIETRRHVAELEALYENGLAVGRLLNPKEIGERIIETFARHLAWHHVVIRLKEPSSDELKLVAFNRFGLGELEKTDSETHLSSAVSRVAQGLSGWVVQTGQPLRTGNVKAQARYVGTYPGIQSGLYMPLKVGDSVIGVINVESKEPNAFTEEDERLLATLASQAAIAFENARLYQSAQKELAERKRVEIELRISETHYRELADSITDVFFELDHDLHYSHWNKAAELLIGVPATDAIGKSMRDVFGESEELIRREKIYKDILEKYQPKTFETILMVNAQPRSFEINAYPSTNGVSVVAKDITERKRTETIMQKRFELMEYAAQHTLEEIIQKAVDEVSQLTGSTIGFFHTLETDQATPGLQTWTTNTLNLFNVPVSEGWHRVVDQAGVWAEAVRQRRPLIQNNYEALPNKKGLPTGHASILREIVIPIIRNEKILAVVGVANKSDEYTYQDLDLAERFADYAWDITERKQMEAALANERNQLATRVDERTIDLSRANSNLARALRVKDEFLANMSHELRTPLNAILGLSESLAEQTAGSLNEKYVSVRSESEIA
ncbi:MAG: PAS domain S-box protein, partial [Chloroflexota bacterium]